MGLDAYARIYTGEVPDAEVDFIMPEDEVPEWYWRKCRQLQGWMTALYLSKGGKDADFNMATLRLTLDDLAALESDLKNGALAARDDHGFFWGGYELDEDDTRKIMEFVKSGRAALEEGLGYPVYFAWY